MGAFLIKGEAFLMKGEVWWRGSPGSCFNKKLRHFINGSGKQKKFL
jgi:hypothetical protein